MNEHERSELQRLKQRHLYLQEQLCLLAGQLESLETRLNSMPQASSLESMEIQPLEIKPAEMPPLTLPMESRQPEAFVRPPPLPPVISPPTTSAPPPVQWPPQPEEIPSTAAAPDSFIPAAAAQPWSTGQSVPPPVIPAEPAARESSFEMRLGTYWLVRVGVVMLLTALAFFGYYAYERYIPRLGPTGKVVLLYVASGILLGLGAWFQRAKVKQSLKNYGQVVFAGGLAAVYFTTFAAHYSYNLRVIQSALVDGLLLLGWAGFMIWLADRRKSEVLALFAIGLAYYTSVITNIGTFTLYSNLVLTLAAVSFLLRNRWANVSFVSLIATYASYVFWRWLHSGKWVWRSDAFLEDFWTGNLFLLGYWVLFTAAVFATRHENFRGIRRASFLTLNNGAFFIFITISLLHVHRAWFWLFALGYGAVLLGLAVAARRLLAEEKLAYHSYLTQGLVLFTVGLIAKFTGLQLALLLAAQSIVLLVLGHLRHERILRAGACIVAALALGWGVRGIEPFDQPGLLLGAALGAMMTFNAWWARRRDAQPDKTLLRPGPAYFVVLALVIWFVTTWQNSPRAGLPLLLAVETLVLTASFYMLRVREVAILGQGYLLLSHLLVLTHFLSHRPSMVWWNPALIVASTLALSHWWQRQPALKCDRQIGQVFQGLYALAMVGLLYHWFHPYFAPPAWLAFTALLAVAITAYGALTRAWLLAMCGQLFLVASTGEFVRQLLRGGTEWYFPLAPIAALVLLSFVVVRWFAHHPEANPSVREPLLQFSLLYRWVALAMSLWWVYQHIPAREQFWVLTLLGLLTFLWSGWRANREALLMAAAFTATGLLLFWMPWRETASVHWPNLLAILTLLVQQQIASRTPDKYRLEPITHAALIILGSLSLWLFFSRWVLLTSGGFYLTVVWSALALGLFVAGLALRERVYRWLGLTVLACALGRVVVFDVWKLETIYRVVSFMALGVVLLVLGFIYNKYLERIRQWL